MHNRDYLKIIIPEIIYVAALGFYLYCLDKLNKELLERYPDNNWMDILAHNNKQPIKYFVVALIFVVIALGLAIYAFFLIRNDYNLSLAGNLWCYISMIVNAVEIVWIIKFIDNPILRAILAGVVVIGGFGYAASSKN